ncbi:Flp pilus assembly protein TadD [Pedobacter sp. UYP30]|uniref:tetratricopeptide repeat protein n=1 Tax=Pedobacter sp. UYP30 TaxID=1756400 RepID=UPI0033909836
MKITKKAIAFNLGLMVMCSAVFAQDLKDAKKAIDAEQYQKAFGILKSLVSSKPSEGENYYSLGILYLKTGAADSARAVFNKGVAQDPKNNLNYIGLGEADMLAGNPTSAKTNFDKAIDIDSRHYETYLEIGKAYLAQDKPSDVPSKPDYTAALANITKADEIDKKDESADVFLAKGDAYALQKNNSEALGPYFRVNDIDATNMRSKTQVGRMYKESRAFPESEKQLQDVIAADANYGPAYRELAEMYLQWSNFGADSTKSAKAIENYKKYMSLTDESVQSKLRFMQFLAYAKDYKELQKVASNITVPANDPKALIVTRLKGWSAYENGDYPNALTYMQDFFAKEKDTTKLLPNDYLYLGQAQIKGGKDTTAAMANLAKAIEKDSTNSGAIGDVATALLKAKKFKDAFNAYKLAVKYNPNAIGSPYNYYYMGQAAFYQSYYDKRDKKPFDEKMLVEADSALTHLTKVDTTFALGVFTQARVNDYIDQARQATDLKGLAIPYYEKYISMIKPEDQEKSKNNLLESYNYIGAYFAEKDKPKAIENLEKSAALDPQGSYAPLKLKELKAAPAKKKK